MAESTGTALSQMNQETALAQEALRDERPQGYPDPQADRCHEERDANLKVIALTTTAMGVMAIGMHVGLWLLLRFFTRTPAPPDAPISPLALNPPTPMAPRIEDATRQNYRRFLRSEVDILGSSGAVALQPRLPVPPISNPGPGVIGAEGDQSPTGNTRIPVEEAKAALLQRGFATRPPIETTSMPQSAPATGAGNPERLPLRMQSPATYRINERPEGTRP